MDTEENVKISIVIPVYNAERYLESCMDSLNRQTSSDYEAIFVDDGSMDRSAEMLKEASLHNSRFKVIHQANSGSGAARSRGLQEASGRMICFLDADDCLEPGMVETIAAKMEPDTDILLFGASVDFIAEGYSIKRIPPVIEADTSHAAVVSALLERDSLNPLWNKAYRADLLKGHGDWFPHDFSQGEDLIFNCSALHEAGRIQSIPDVLYHYVKRPDQTLVSSYTDQNQHILMRKKQALHLLFPDAHDLVLCRYLLKEYEAFAINLVMKGCPMTFAEKKDMARQVIMIPEAEYQIRHGNPDYANGRVFRFLCGFHSAGFLIASYQVLIWMRDTFSGIYQGIRKKSYLRGGKGQ